MSMTYCYCLLVASSTRRLRRASMAVADTGAADTAKHARTRRRRQLGMHIYLLGRSVGAIRGYPLLAHSVITATPTCWAKLTCTHTPSNSCSSACIRIIYATETAY